MNGKVDGIQIALEDELTVLADMVKRRREWFSPSEDKHNMWSSIGIQNCAKAIIALTEVAYKTTATCRIHDFNQTVAPGDDPLLDTACTS